VADQSGIGRAQSALGGDDGLIPVPGELITKRLAEQLLGRAETVGLRGVEEIDAQLASPANRRDGRVLIEAAPFPAELPGAERDAGDVQSAPAWCGHLHVVVPRNS